MKPGGGIADFTGSYDEYLASRASIPDRETTPSTAAALIALGTDRVAAQEALRAESIRAHLEFLADDLLEGREAGTRGYDITAGYVASQFKQIGLAPAGDEEYFQAVPLRRSLLVTNSVTLQVQRAGKSVTFTEADHVAARPSATEADQKVEARCAFAGYGIVSPEHGIDDYKGLDVRGKFVVVLGGPPPGLPSKVAGHLGSTDEQRATAARHGAIGLLVIYTPALEKRWPFRQLQSVYHQPQFEWVSDEVGPGRARPLRVSALVDQPRRQPCSKALRAVLPRS